MKKSILIRRIAVILLTSAFLFHAPGIPAEGLLPSFKEVAGIEMPSLGEALERYPDSETENGDGSVTEHYTNITEGAYNTFSGYLSDQGAEAVNPELANGILTAEIRVKGASVFLVYNSRTGEADVTYPSGTYDGRTKNAKLHLAEAERLLNAGKANDAYAEILAIADYEQYEPVSGMLAGNSEFAAAMRNAKLAQFRTLGSIVTFGRYEQDNDKANGPEKIEWVVLAYDEENHKTLLVSRYGLDTIPYHTTSRVTWETCSLRAWLNSTFLNSAFSEQERQAILTAEVKNDKAQAQPSNAKGGKDTQDKIFLLSYVEMNLYFTRTTRIAPTPYATSQGAYTSESTTTPDGKPAGEWWVRHPDTNPDFAFCVDEGGSMSHTGMDNTRLMVVPVLWLNLDAVIF